MALAQELEELARALTAAIEQRGRLEVEQRVFELAARSTPRRNALLLNLAWTGWRQAERDGCYEELEEAYLTIWDGAAMALRIRANKTDPTLV